PTATPAIEPIVKARIDSVSVIIRCFQITPLANQATIWLPTSTGLEKKNVGSRMRPNTGTVVRNCHSATPTTATDTWQTRSIKRDMSYNLSPGRTGERRDPIPDARCCGRSLRHRLNDRA